MKFRDFTTQSFKEFEEQLKNQKMAGITIRERIKGAREFGSFLVNEPHLHRERTKDTI